MPYPTLTASPSCESSPSDFARLAYSNEALLAGQRASLLQHQLERAARLGRFHNRSSPCPHKVRRGSVFGPGWLVPVSVDLRQQWLDRVGEAATHGHLPHSAERFAYHLLQRMGAHGQCNPSMATLASDTGLSKSTIWRHTVRFQQLGLLDWDRRRDIKDGKDVQTSNQYRILLLHDPAVISCRLVRKVRQKPVSIDTPFLSSANTPSGTVLGVVTASEDQLATGLSDSEVSGLAGFWSLVQADRWAKPPDPPPTG